jgi:hypothetical protein
MVAIRPIQSTWVPRARSQTPFREPWADNPQVMDYIAEVLEDESELNLYEPNCLARETLRAQLRLTQRSLCELASAIVEAQRSLPRLDRSTRILGTCAVIFLGLFVWEVIAPSAEVDSLMWKVKLLLPSLAVTCAYFSMRQRTRRKDLNRCVWQARTAIITGWQALCKETSDLAGVTEQQLDCAHHARAE